MEQETIPGAATEFDPEELAQITQLETLADLHRCSDFLPRSINTGNVLHSVLADQLKEEYEDESIALQMVYAAFAADRIVQGVKRPELFYPDESLRNLKFTQEFLEWVNILERSFVALMGNKDKVVQEINFNAKALLGRANGNDLYTPYRLSGSYVEVFKYQTYLAENLLNSPQRAEVFQAPVVVKVTGKRFRSSLIPSAIPSSTLPEFNAGSFSVNKNASFIEGEIALITAVTVNPLNDQAFYFIMSNKRSGWISEDQMKELTESGLSNDREAGTPQGLWNNTHRNWSYAGGSEMDCMTSLRIALLEGAGIDHVPGYSGDLASTLEASSVENFTISSVDGLEKLPASGMCLLQLLDSKGGSRHIFTYANRTVTSNAFMIRYFDGDGNQAIKYPLGYHYDQSSILSAYVKSGFKIRAFVIARP